MRGHIILCHGSNSSPEATKVSALAALGETLGWHTQRLDFRADDALGSAESVFPRITRLQAAMDACNTPPLLVGSSMGAFVAGLASLQRPVAGLFLLATPEAIPGYPIGFDLRTDVPTLLIHGWRDEVCPLDDLFAWASRRQLPLLVLDDDHRLGDSMDAITTQFRGFLETLARTA